MRSATYVLLFLAALSGLYIHLSESWSLTYKFNLALHPLVALAASAVAIPFLVHHVRSVRPRRAPAARASGWSTPALLAAALISGVILVPGVDHATERLLLHRYISYGAAALVLFHVGGTILRSSNRGGRRLVELSTAALLPFLVAAFPIEKNQKVIFDRFLTENPPPNAHADALLLARSCGLTVACHESLTKEFLDAAHYRAPESAHFQKITSLLGEERGVDATRFCISCHAPGHAVSQGPVVADQPGFGCLVCHALHEPHVPPSFEKERAGYTLRLPLRHLDMFPETDGTELDPLNDYLIRLNPLGHGRALTPETIDKDVLCLSCHQEHIQREPHPQFIQPRCIDCHMGLQEPLSKAGTDRPHLFLGANVVTPHLRGDREMEGKVRSWLTGYFETEVLDSFWELRSNAESRPSRAVWLVMSIETLDDPRPGHPLRIRLHTSNVGIGHAFPSGVLDLYDVWFELNVYDSNNVLLYASGYSGGVFHQEDGVHRIGGYFEDANHLPIQKHRIWEKKGRVQRVIEPGRTIEDDFVMDIPRSAQGPLRITARLVYERLNTPFKTWVFGSPIPDLPVVEIASASRSAPVIMD